MYRSIHPVTSNNQGIRIQTLCFSRFSKFLGSRSKCCKTYAFQYISHTFRSKLKIVENSDFCIGRLIPPRPTTDANTYKHQIFKISIFLGSRSECCKTYVFQYTSHTFRSKMQILENNGFYIGRLTPSRPTINANTHKHHINISRFLGSRPKCCKTYAFQYTSNTLRSKLKNLENNDFCIGRLIPSRPTINANKYKQHIFQQLLASATETVQMKLCRQFYLDG